MTDIAPPAFFGKLPSHGDFVFRGLSRSSAETIDLWLASWLNHCSAALSHEFDTAYYSAQPWLFSGSKCQAIVIPSADQVDRKFPLFAISNSDIPIQHFYDTVVAAIGEGWSPDTLLAGLTDDEQSPASTLDGPGWFLADESQSALPHPMDVEEATPMRGVFV